MKDKKFNIKDPYEVIKSIKSKITKQDIFIIILVFILGLITNFTFFTGKGIAPDALQAEDFNMVGKWEVSLGRFGLYIANLFRFGLVNKFLIIILSLTFLGIAVTIITRIFEIKSKLLTLFIAGIVAVAPQFTETYFFIYCADAYCFAFLLSALTVLFLKKANKQKRYYIFAGICVVTVCSLYQAYLGVILGLTIILVINDLLNNEKIKDVIIRGLKYVGTIFIGIVIYYIILKIIIHILGISLADYKGANGFGLDTILALPKTILQTYIDFFKFFFSNEIISNSFWKRKHINLILFVIFGCGLLNIMLKEKYSNKLERILLIVLLLIIFPIGINVMNLIAAGTSMNLVTGSGMITAILLLCIVYRKLDKTLICNIIKYGNILVILVLIYTFILQNTYTYMCREETYANYYAVINNIYSRASSIEGFSKDQKWMVSFIIKYKPKYADRANGFISNDNETWEHADGILQNASFFRKYLGINIEMCSKEEYVNITRTEEFQNMPIYPEDGSIRIINNIVVVKTSDEFYI